MKKVRKKIIKSYQKKLKKFQHLNFIMGINHEGHFLYTFLQQIEIF